MTKVTCPDIRSWQALLETGGSGDEQADLVGHLEICADCQQTLEGLAGDRTVWEAIAQGLVEPARHEPALQCLVERLKSEDPAPVADDDLSFLRPAERPGLLGLLGSFEVREEIGRGAMGVVLKAFDPDLNRVVAIKVLAPRLATSATARRRFVREGRAAAAVRHDHIVTVYSVSEAEGLPYIVMQYINESLQDRLDRAGPLKLEEIVKIGLETAAGLAAAHAQGLIHRDIKPANLLLEHAPERVGITDFGLARMADDVRLTQDGVITGTPEYMAPEQARGETVDCRADLFSLGSVIYAMATGVSPFHGMSPLAVLRQVSDQAPSSIRSLNPTIPAWLEAFVARLLAKNPADRFQSAAEVAALLEGYRAHLAQPETIPAPPLPAAPFSEETGRNGGNEKRERPLPFRVSWTAGFFVILVALGLGAGSWFAGCGGGPEKPPPRAETDTRNLPVAFYHDFRMQPLPALGASTVGIMGSPWGQGTFLAAAALSHDRTSRLPDGLELFNVRPSKLLWQPEGLTIDTAKLSRVDTSKGIGVAATFGLTGDFEITTTLEFLDMDIPPPAHWGVGMGIYIGVPRSNPGAHIARLVRAENNHGIMWTCWRTDKEEGISPCSDKILRLRLKRTGSTLAYLWAPGIQGGDFQKASETEFGRSDIAVIRLAAFTGKLQHGSNEKVRVLDLQIRGQTTDNPVLNPPHAVAGNAQAPILNPRKGGLAAALLVGLMISIALALVVWLVVARRRRAQGASAAAAGTVADAALQNVAERISFQCSSCEKKLKAKAALAGKKIKCPQCGNGVLVPGTAVDESARVAGSES